MAQAFSWCHSVQRTVRQVVQVNTKLAVRTSQTHVQRSPSPERAGTQATVFVLAVYPQPTKLHGVILAAYQFVDIGDLCSMLRVTVLHRRL